MNISTVGTVCQRRRIISMEVIRKRYLSGQKLYGLDLGAEPPCIKPG